MESNTIDNIIDYEGINALSPLSKVIFMASQRVYSELGIGHSEAIYQKALMYELNHCDMSIDIERNIDVVYTDSKGNDRVLGSERIDLFIHNNVLFNEGNVILELKATPKCIGDKEIFQLKKYFRQCNKNKIYYSYGIIINFPQALIKTNFKDPTIHFMKLKSQQNNSQL